MKQINVAIIGATGAVGQRFIQLLTEHPYFKIKGLLASSSSVGKKYGEIANWLVTEKIPDSVKEMAVTECRPESLENDSVEIVFSALPSDIAREVEPAFARAGYKVFSNASAFRKDPQVPLVVAEINAEHMRLVEDQKKVRGWSGFIVTNPNCSTIIMVLPLKPLQDAFGIKKVIVSTMQAVSGAGYPGVPSLDIVDNILPYIAGEEEKVENEPLKILGSMSDEPEMIIKPAGFVVSASCQRVPTIDGHFEDLHISLGREVRVDEVKKVLADFDAGLSDLPTAPKVTIIVTDDPKRPQTRLDRNTGKGMTITVGRIRKDPVLENGIKMSILGHNTIRGAAGQSILNAEYFVERLSG